MSIHLNKPYKINSSKQKRYEAHYRIPAAEALVVPLKEMGEEVSCEIRWEDANGELQVIQNAMFVAGNLTPLNALLDVKLFEIWNHYYNPVDQKS